MTEHDGWYPQQPEYPHKPEYPQQAQYPEPAPYPHQAGYQQGPHYQQPDQAYPYEQGYQPGHQAAPPNPQQPYGYQQDYYQSGYDEQRAHPQNLFDAAVPQPSAPPVAAPRPPAAQPTTAQPSVAAPRPRPIEPDEPSEAVGGRRRSETAYPTGEFTFVDEDAEESEDVIDWLKFAESRSERRDERHRRLRKRLIGVVVTLALLASGGAGYLWWSGRLGGAGTVAAAVGGRQVNVVHLRDLNGTVTTALLVDDESGHKGTALLLPDTLSLPSGDGSGTTTVGQALDALGASGTRDGLNTVLGAHVVGTWRLDTPFLTLLVAQLGGIKVDTNADVHEGNSPSGKLLAPKGQGVTLTGQAAAAYATYQAPGEQRGAQLARFGQVLNGLVQAMPTDLAEATDDVHRMNAVLDPSLPEKALAGVLAALAQQAGQGHFGVSTLQVEPDGTLDEATAGAQVKNVLGGTVHSARSSAGTARVAIVNASGSDQAAAAAAVQITNAGLNLLPGATKAQIQATSEIRYTDDSRQAAAAGLAAALNLPATAVKKVTDPQTADLVLVLGKDYQPPTNQ